MLQRLRVFFRHGNSTFTQKLRVFHAILGSKLMYGLESTMLNQSVLKWLDTFLLKGLRKILQLPTTYVDRSYTNACVIDRANTELETEGHEAMTLLSDLRKKKRMALLAKSINLGPSDPSAVATLDHETLRPHDYGKKRVEDQGSTG